MANSPPFDEQLAQLARFQAFGGTEPLPGNILSADRFVRATYFLRHLPAPRTYAEALAGVIHIAGNVAVPPGAPYDDFSVYPTWWTSAADLSNSTYYFWSRLSRALIWVPLADLDLRPDAPARWLDPGKPELVGQVTEAFLTQEGPLPY
jgi:choloylglycine hydrolase